MNYCKFLIAFATTLFLFVGTANGQPPGGGFWLFFGQGSTWDNWIEFAVWTPNSFVADADCDLTPDGWTTGDLGIVTLESTGSGLVDNSATYIGPFPASLSGSLDSVIDQSGVAVADLTGGTATLFSGEGPLSLDDGVFACIPTAAAGYKTYGFKGTARVSTIIGGYDIQGRLAVENPGGFDLKVEVEFVGNGGSCFALGWTDVFSGQSDCDTYQVNGVSVPPLVDSSGQYYLVNFIIKDARDDSIITIKSPGRAYVE